MARKPPRYCRLLGQILDDEMRQVKVTPYQNVVDVSFRSVGEMPPKAFEHQSLTIHRYRIGLEEEITGTQVKPTIFGVAGAEHCGRPARRGETVTADVAPSLAQYRIQAARAFVQKREIPAEAVKQAIAWQKERSWRDVDSRESERNETRWKPLRIPKAKATKRQRRASPDGMTLARLSFRCPEQRGVRTGGTCGRERSYRQKECQPLRPSSNHRAERV